MHCDLEGPLFYLQMYKVSVPAAGIAVERYATRLVEVHVVGRTPGVSPICCCRPIHTAASVFLSVFCSISMRPPRSWRLPVSFSLQTHELAICDRHDRG